MKYISQGQDELLHHLREQIEFLRASASSFDNGHEDEAKRLAVVIRVLVHDTKNSTSLLTQLNKKNINFYDSAADYNPSLSLPAHSGLAIMRISAEASWVAPLDDMPPSRNKNKKVTFEEWWNKKIVLVDEENNRFTRRLLVINVADTDGGAHVDPNLNVAYANLSRFSSLGWKFFRNDVEGDFENRAVLPSIRQIAHEVLKTLKDEFPDL